MRGIYKAEKLTFVDSVGCRTLRYMVVYFAKNRYLVTKLLSMCEL